LFSPRVSALFGTVFDMRLVLRVLGTWLLGIGVILFIIDGTKSLAVNAIVMTSLQEMWSSLHPESLMAVKGFVATRFFGALLEEVLNVVLTFPAFAVVAVPGIALALLGRSRASRIRQYTEV
jgi:Na+/phosphate symporter